MKNMKKKEAKQALEQQFPHIIASNDKPAKRQMWNDYLDHLEKAGQITRARADTWVNPFIKKLDRYK